MLLRFLLVVIAATFLSTPGFAQYTGPGAEGGGNTTVREVLKSKPDDSLVTLRGQITKKISHEKYLFTDGTGQITLDIDDKYFPYDTPITPKTTIEITGEVEKKFIGRTKIDVKKIIVIGEGAARKPRSGFQSN